VVRVVPTSIPLRQISKTFHGGAHAADNALRDLVEKYGEQGHPDGWGVTVGRLGRSDRLLTLRNAGSRSLGCA
jgi:hypothetical protein